MRKRSWKRPTQDSPTSYGQELSTFLLFSLDFLFQFQKFQGKCLWSSFVNIMIPKWSRLVVSDSLRPHGLQPPRLLHPWDFPGKSTGVGCHCLLQGIFPTTGLNPGLPHCRWRLYPLSPLSFCHSLIFLSLFQITFSGETSALSWGHSTGTMRVSLGQKWRLSAKIQQRTEYA